MDHLGWLWGALILALQIWAIVDLLKSNKDTGKKVLWALFIIFIPVIGLVFYFLLGRERYASI